MRAQCSNFNRPKNVSEDATDQQCIIDITHSKVDNIAESQTVSCEINLGRSRTVPYEHDTAFKQESIFRSPNNTKVAKTATDRSREHRIRQKALKNAVSSEYSAHVRGTSTPVLSEYSAYVRGTSTLATSSDSCQEIEEHQQFIVKADVHQPNFAVLLKTPSTNNMRAQCSNFNRPKNVSEDATDQQCIIDITHSKVDNIAESQTVSCEINLGRSRTVPYEHDTAFKQESIFRSPNNTKVAKTATDRSREHRIRQKALKNAVSSEYSAHVRGTSTPVLSEYSAYVRGTSTLATSSDSCQEIEEHQQFIVKADVHQPNFAVLLKTPSTNNMRAQCSNFNRPKNVSEDATDQQCIIDITHSKVDNIAEFQNVSCEINGERSGTVPYERDTAIEEEAILRSPNNTKVAKTATDRSREHRTRQKALKNAVSSEYSAHVRGTSTQATSKTVKRKQCDGCPASNSSQEVEEDYQQLIVQADVHQPNFAVLLRTPSTSNMRTQCSNLNRPKNNSEDATDQQCIIDTTHSKVDNIAEFQNVSCEINRERSGTVPYERDTAIEEEAILRSPNNTKVAKTATDRSREHRTRQKALKNAVSSEYSAHVRGTSTQATSKTVKRKQCDGCPASNSSQEVEEDHQQFIVQADVHQPNFAVLSRTQSTRNMRTQCSNLNRPKNVSEDATDQQYIIDVSNNAANQDPMMDTIYSHVDDIVVFEEIRHNEISQENENRITHYENPIEPPPIFRSPSSIENDNLLMDNEAATFRSPYQNSMSDIANSVRLMNNTMNGNQPEDSCLPYTMYHRHDKAHRYFKIKFEDDCFGKICSVCDRLWFKSNLKSPSEAHAEILKQIVPEKSVNEILLCTACMTSVKKQKIPALSTYNGFQFPKVPNFLPALDLVSERLISPRIPFMQIRRLRHVNGQYGIYGQVINVPVSVNTMVNHLPRSVSDDHCINVHIKRKKIHKTSYLHGIVNKRTIKAWLQYMVTTPLYIMYDIKIDNSFFDSNVVLPVNPQDEYSEHIPLEESLTAQQHTLLWNEDQHLRIAPGEENQPESLLFDEYAEELSFPSIYLGQFRRFKEEAKVTPFMIATSELRRSDRRAVTPYHLLYMAMKIMRLRVRDALTVAFKHVGKNTTITRQQIEDQEYVNNCIETNLAFLRSIPNSTWYWASRKKDLFAMIRQLGKPTIFLTVSANEIGWIDLLRELYKLKHNGEEISSELAENLHYIERTTLVNEDAVTCAIYFNKLVNTLLTILQSKKFSPFGQYYVVDYFKRIEFQHRGSPHAHVLLWLNNAPQDAIGENKLDAISLIDNLISVSSKESSGNIKLQTQKHTFTCYKKIVANRPQQCRFEAPFMPSRATIILLPMRKEEPGFNCFIKEYRSIRLNLESNEYTDIDHFYRENNILSDDHYHSVLRAGISRPRVFLKRHPHEKWHNPFNPFILNKMKSNMDIQFITEEYSCAAYVAEYVNKTTRGVSHLQRQIIEIMDENPEFDIVEVTRKIGVNMLNSVEMTSQEAAWYLLREPMSKSSTSVVNIATVWPIERQRVRKAQKELDDMGIGEDSTDIWKLNWFDKYERRHEDLEAVTLAQFVSNYTVRADGSYNKRAKPRVIRYRNYDMGQDLNEYKREMVTLHIPFRNEEAEVLAELNFIKIYDENEDQILNSRKEFESTLDIQKTIEICHNLCRENNHPDGSQQVQDAANRVPEIDPFQHLYNDPNSDANADIRLAVLNKLGPVAKKRENLLPNTDFCQLMRMANEKQSELLRHVIYHLLSTRVAPLQIFLTGPAGCGKTFVIKLIMDIYNRFTNNDGICNAYITCASTGKAAVAIDGTTVHTALKISLSKLLPLSIEVAHQYRALFKYVKVLIIDEISMIGAELLAQIDARLNQITGDYGTNFGGIDIVLIGDLRQLPPVRATPIYKQQKQTIVGPILWRGLKFFELQQVMRQANQVFSSILTKIGNGEKLQEDEVELIESRFYTTEEAKTRCPHGIRLFNTNLSVTKYNNKILNEADEKTISLARDVYTGCTSAEQEAFVRQKLHKMSIIDTGGLPYETVFVIGVLYMVTTNIDVADGLANGAVGKLVHLDLDETGQVSVAWLNFPDSSNTGEKIRRKVAGHVATNNILKTAVPIGRRSSTIALNNNRTINAKRSHLPLVCACATTIHKSQGSTYSEVVYEYDKKHGQSLVYVALSRVTCIEGLFITTESGDSTFYHGRRASFGMSHLQAEFRRLALNSLETVDKQIIDRITQVNEVSIYSFNCQSLRAHSADLNDAVIRKSNIVILSETWLSNDEEVNVPNLSCVVQHKRASVRAGGVAIFYNQVCNSGNVVTPSTQMTARQCQTYASAMVPVGDICFANCQMGNGKNIVIVAIYITPNKSMRDIISFIDSCLLAYSTADGDGPDRGDDQTPLILAGDFNVNFGLENSFPLTRFLREKFGLILNTNPNEATTKSGTTIDAVFSRNLQHVESKTYISYFSYHKPILSIYK